MAPLMVDPSDYLKTPPLGGTQPRPICGACGEVRRSNRQQGLRGALRLPVLGCGRSFVGCREFAASGKGAVTLSASANPRPRSMQTSLSRRTAASEFGLLGWHSIQTHRR